MSLMECLRSLYKRVRPSSTPRQNSKPSKRRRPRMSFPTSDNEQPSKGSLVTLRSGSTYSRLGMSSAQSQAILNRRRRQFVATLPHDHALRKRMSVSTGELVQARLQPNGRAREIAGSPEQVRSRRKIRKSRDDVDSANWQLERNRFLGMWNGIGERATREEEWIEFDRVKPKLLSLKRKHCFLDRDLQDERELDRKRAKSRRRSQRENISTTSGNDSDRWPWREISKIKFRNSSQDHHRNETVRDNNEQGVSPRKRLARINKPLPVVDDFDTEDEDCLPIVDLPPPEEGDLPVVDPPSPKESEYQMSMNEEMSDSANEDNEFPPICELPDSEPVRRLPLIKRKKSNDDGVEEEWIQLSRLPGVPPNGDWFWREYRDFEYEPDDNDHHNYDPPPVLELPDDDDDILPVLELPDLPARDLRRISTADLGKGSDKSAPAEPQEIEPIRNKSSTRMKSVDAVKAPELVLPQPQSPRSAFSIGHPTIKNPVLKPFQARRLLRNIEDNAEDEDGSLQPFTGRTLGKHPAPQTQQSSRRRTPFGFSIPAPESDRPSTPSATRFDTFIHPRLRNLPSVCDLARQHAK